MLVLSRKIRQGIKIGDATKIWIVKLQNGQVRIGIETMESNVITRIDEPATAPRKISAKLQLAEIPVPQFLI